jgi:pyruvate dehydrogenase E1 component
MGSLSDPVDDPVDIDSAETREWCDALENVIAQDGPVRAHFLLEKLMEKARRLSPSPLPFQATTAYLNTIPVSHEARSPGDLTLESRIRAYIRWNAMAMVVRAGKRASELGGHIASFASSATLYDIGFNHFFHAATDKQDADLLYIQGHVSPGIYARSFLEGRLSEQDLDCFRQEIGQKGLSSYPHPWLMPDYWQFATVSMGLGPLQAIYQARFLKYLHHRGLADTQARKVWCFCGDGEMDEPESLGAISLAGREKLDNLIFVINCNLQRLDGPVRGNGKIIQEFEGVFRGAGWNVLKVIWGRYWDPLLAEDKEGLLVRRMEEALDGDYQNYKAHGGAYTREHFFGKYPELKERVAHLSDDDIWRLNRGGHDPTKVYAAYHAAVNHTGQPTVILAKTIKGYGMGIGFGEAANITHQLKKIDLEGLKQFRDRFDIPVSDADLPNVPYCKPPDNGPELAYLKARREALGGFLPARRMQSDKHYSLPDLSVFKTILEGSGDREISTTMAFTRIFSLLLKEKSIKEYLVPIIPDEARTFGMEGFFRQLGIYSSVGQLYAPVDSEQVMYYREDQKGQLLEEGITEAGAFCSWLAAATSYSNHNLPMIPFYIFYSMFGFQRIGDLAWAAGDMRARGFLLGGTAGRTTLPGEGLQHCDGQSLVMAGLVPNCRSYDPTYGYELAVIIQYGLKQMYTENQSVFYYITLMTENYVHPGIPVDRAVEVEQGIIQGMYLLKNADNNPKNNLKIRLLGSGAILREALAAAHALETQWGVQTEVWSVTSFTELAREGQDQLRWNQYHPEAVARQAYVTQCLATQGFADPTIGVVAATDYVRTYAEQIRPYVSGRYTVLGTDGFGRSDTRARLRYFFEVDRASIVLAALKNLADSGLLQPARVSEVLQYYGLDPEKQNPVWI